MWNMVLVSNAQRIRGQIESSTRENYSSSQKLEEMSEMGRLAAVSRWLPSASGEFNLPGTLSLNDLPDDFDKDQNLARQLGMPFPHPPVPPGVEAQFAERFGVSMEDVQFLSDHKAEFEEFKRWQLERKPKPKPPEAESRNPGLRAERAAEEAANAEFVERLIRERQVRCNWDVVREARTILVVWNTNEDGEMVCQVCRHEMPFKLDDGSYYFEAVECVKGLGLELPQNHLSLCPICAAKYRHANGTPPDELKKRILDTSGSEVPVTLAREECRIGFTNVPLLDLQAALKAV